MLENIDRDYKKSLVYGDVALKTNPFKAKDTTSIIARVGFTKYIDQ